MLILVYILIGIIAGFFSGLLGIGGGILIVPALLFAFKLHNISTPYLMQIAIGTSLAVISISAIFSYFTHTKNNPSIFPIYKKLMYGIIVGTIIGAVFASSLSSHLLRILFGILLIAVAILMLTLIKQSSKKTLPHAVKTNTMGAIIGFFAGLFGIGGGIITVPYLSYYQVNLRSAIGASAAVSFSVAVIGVISYLFLGLSKSGLPAHTIGFIYWPAVIVIGLFSPVFAFLGARVARKTHTTTLRYIFSVLLVLVGLKMLV